MISVTSAPCSIIFTVRGSDAEVIDDVGRALQDDKRLLVIVTLRHHSWISLKIRQFLLPSEELGVSDGGVASFGGRWRRLDFLDLRRDVIVVRLLCVRNRKLNITLSAFLLKDGIKLLFDIP